MNFPTLIAKQLRDAYFGGDWTAVNVKDTLTDIDWRQASRKVYGFNSIVTLVYHTRYYIKIVTNVLQGLPLDGHDKDSFVHPALQSQPEWEGLLQEMWSEAEAFATLIENLPEERLKETFVH